MAIHIADPKTDAMVRELARRWNKTLTEVVRIVATRSLERLEASKAKTVGARKGSKRNRSSGPS